ncbi:MAG: LysM peptidoglycan-binding domain-containing protein [Bacillota bacterium]|nr:LysM peptidoglycan-binding domain-containing protein [Bacillota bacterium]HOO29356.1 LysM peptidoglycan-binding domain-containing protein [Bacillota bacterium]HPZ12623.1 LysM peptidoglycan-binding domain-containing protein [Bacillota bacterium]
MDERKPLVLMRGMIAIPVGNLQEQLAFKGFPLGEVDNVFGIRTELAVKQFQASVGLPETGIVDAQTWRLLFDGLPLPDEVFCPDDSLRYDNTVDYRGYSDRSSAGRMCISADKDKSTNGGSELALSASSKSRQGPSIHVSLSQRRLTLLQSERESAQYPVAIGKPATPTPVGNWSILNKALNPGGVFGTRWMGFTRQGHGIHGTNQPQSIGHAVSNGCIRMYTPDVESLFTQVSVGTPVVIDAGVPFPTPAPGTYIVRSGDTLYLIARRFGTTVEAIRRTNNLTTDIISVGQVLFLPGPTGAPPIIGTDYVVQPGDTLFLIARRFGTTVQAIMSANNLTSTNIYVGQRLRIPGGPRTAAQMRAQSGASEYVVQPGDTLHSISAAFGIPVEAIIAANTMISSDIYPGQLLRMP